MARRLSVLLALSVGLVGVTVGSAPARADGGPPPTLTLSGTLRDVDHPHTIDPGNAPATNADFETGAGNDTAIVGALGAALGTDGTPAYAGGPDGTGTSTTSGPTTFGQWYHDTPGVTATVPLDLTLAQVGTTDSYTYVNDSFFPADGLGWNAPGAGATPQVERGHNYSFTYETHNLFTYEGGESFTFCGDDDVFAYVNRSLVVNLGGIHAKRCSTVDIDSLGLASGHTYPFDLFFAERHTTGSNFEFTTSLQLRTTSSLSDAPSAATSAGGTISDTATLSAGASPTGTITFTLYGPGDLTCAHPLSTMSVPVDGSRTYPSGLVVVGVPGTYTWISTYSGDDTNAGTATVCGASTVAVSPARISRAPSPDAVVITRIVPRPRRLTVSFAPVGTHQIAFRGYVVTCTPLLAGLRAHTAYTRATTVLMTGLTDNRDYRCVVVGTLSTGVTVISAPRPGRPGQLPRVTLAAVPRVPTGHRVRLTGLAIVGGRPAAHSVITITGRAEGSHQRLPVARVRTDAQGRFTYTARLGSTTAYQATLHVGVAVARNKELLVRAT